VDPDVRDRIVAAAELGPGSLAVEIGPGTGVLTEAMLPTGASVLAIVGAFFAVGCIGLGSAVDRIGSKLVFVICFILIVASVLALSMIREVWMLYLFAVVYGWAPAAARR
jgi:MFS family permease